MGVVERYRRWGLALGVIPPEVSESEGEDLGLPGGEGDESDNGGGEDGGSEGESGAADGTLNHDAGAANGTVDRDSDAGDGSQETQGGRSGGGLNQDGSGDDTAGHHPNHSQPTKRNPWTDDDARMHAALSAVYGDVNDATGGNNRSQPNVGRWMSEVREYFPESVASVLFVDAFERQDWRDMLFQPEALEKIKPNVKLMANLINMRKCLPYDCREPARKLIERLVEELVEKIADKTTQTIRGAREHKRNNKPKFNEINWHKTITANLATYNSATKTIVPERIVGFNRVKKREVELDQITLCVDQSGSMAESTVYAAIFASVIASLPNVKTRLVAFDTEVVDWTGDLEDPVEVLWGIQAGGGTDINRAVEYCRQFIVNPSKEHFILITDLFEGGNKASLIRNLKEMTEGGVNVVTLLALTDSGQPGYSRHTASEVAALGIPVFYCTPDNFPSMIAAAIRRENMFRWTETKKMVTIT